MRSVLPDRWMRSGCPVSLGPSNARQVLKPRVAWVFSAGCLVLAACSPTVEPGDAHVVTEGVDSWSLGLSDEPEGGIVEVGRVWFAGNDLYTDLVGDKTPDRADGWTLTVGTARFVLPRSSRIASFAQVLPPGPDPTPGEPMVCEVARGPVADVLQTDVLVDVGDLLHVESADGTLTFDLQRSPLNRGTPGDAIAYFGMEVTRAPDDLAGPGNWLSGARISLRSGGGNPAADRRFATIPVAFALADPIALPLKLSGVSIDGVAVTGAVRSPATGDVVAPAPTWTLPGEDRDLTLEWDVWSTSGTLVMSLEYYGGGTGRCPSACNQGECCERNDQCRDHEVCAARRLDGRYVCMPRVGDGRDRLAALVCTLPDTGTAVLTGEQVHDLETRLADWGLLDAVRGVVLRLGRTSTWRVSLPDAMMADGTAQAVSPVIARAADVVMVRMQRIEQ